MQYYQQQSILINFQFYIKLIVKHHPQQESSVFTLFFRIHLFFHLKAFIDWLENQEYNLCYNKIKLKIPQIKTFSSINILQNFLIPFNFSPSYTDPKDSLASFKNILLQQNQETLIGLIYSIQSFISILYITVEKKWAYIKVPINVITTVIKEDIFIIKLALNPSFDILGGAQINLLILNTIRKLKYTNQAIIIKQIIINLNSSLNCTQFKNQHIIKQLLNISNPQNKINQAIKDKRTYYKQEFACIVPYVACIVCQSNNKQSIQQEITSYQQYPAQQFMIILLFNYQYIIVKTLNNLQLLLHQTTKIFNLNTSWYEIFQIMGLSSKSIEFILRNV
ncbi:hypothetical protein pb186bvf_009330 [Paramecium bursaria]